MCFTTILSLAIAAQSNSDDSCSKYDKIFPWCRSYSEKNNIGSNLFAPLTSKAFCDAGSMFATIRKKLEAFSPRWCLSCCDLDIEVHEPAERYRQDLNDRADAVLCRQKVSRKRTPRLPYNPYATGPLEITIPLLIAYAGVPNFPRERHTYTHRETQQGNPL